MILPGDIRNDLYLTIVSGDFSGLAKASGAKNIEVCVKVCGEKGQILPGNVLQYYNFKSII